MNVGIIKAYSSKEEFIGYMFEDESAMIDVVIKKNDVNFTELKFGDVSFLQFL